jgi:perosamine synthetase
VSQPSITAIEIDYVTRAVKSGWVSSIGVFVEAFESGFARFCGVEHAISVSNGTCALHLSLLALDIGPGDEVITPDLSFIATANAVLMSGAKPIFADIDPETLCLEPPEIERRLSSRTRAIIPVHLYGHPADMRAINAIAAKHGLVVIEDAAEAHGAGIDGAKVGGFGRCAAFSFYANKNMTTGEGGMITTNDARLAARSRSLRDHAMSSTRRYWHEELGYNYRMTNLQAALGCAQLERADELAGGREEICGWYREALSDLKGARFNRAAAWAKPAYWLACLEIDGLRDDRRAVLMRALRQRGVDTRPYFYPMSAMPYLEAATTPVAHAIAEKGLNLPTYLGLTRSDVLKICGVVHEEVSALLVDDRR